jgi:hypothetical protein
MTELSEQRCALSDDHQVKNLPFALGPRSSPLSVEHSPLFHIDWGFFSHRGTFWITLITPFTIPDFRFFHNHKVPGIRDSVLSLAHS